MGIPRGGWCRGLADPGTDAVQQTRCGAVAPESSASLGPWRAAWTAQSGWPHPECGCHGVPIQSYRPPWAGPTGGFTAGWREGWGLLTHWAFLPLELKKTRAGGPEWVSRSWQNPQVSSRPLPPNVPLCSCRSLTFNTLPRRLSLPQTSLSDLPCPLLPSQPCVLLPTPLSGCLCP